MIGGWIQTATLVRRSRVGSVCALAIRDTAGSATALAAKYKYVRRGSFMASPLQFNIILIFRSRGRARLLHSVRPAEKFCAIMCTVANSTHACTSADKIIDIEFHISAECLAGHSYIDMTRFLRRSDGKMHVKSGRLAGSFESLEAAHGEESGQKRDEAMIFASAAGAGFLGSPRNCGDHRWET